MISLTPRFLGSALLLAAFSPCVTAPLDHGLLAQATTTVPLQSFDNTADAERFVSQLVIDRERETARLAALYRCRPRGTLSEVLGGRRDSTTHRRRIAASVDTAVPLCPETRRDRMETTVVVPLSARYLVTYDTDAVVAQNGNAVQRMGDAIVTSPGGQLTHFDVRSTPRVVSSRKAVLDRFDYEPGGWADELVFSGNVAALLDYGGTRGGTKLLLYTKRADGSLAPRDSLTLSGLPPTGNSNTALRLRGNQLVVYTAAELPYSYQEPLFFLSPYARGTGESVASPDPWRDAVRDQRVFRPSSAIDALSVSTIHHIMRCDIASPTLSCETTSILAPRAQTFALLHDVLYVVTDDATPPRAPASVPEAALGSLVIRVPLSNNAPTAFRVDGRPADRFALHEEKGVLFALLTPSTRPSRDASDPAATPPDTTTPSSARLLSIPVGPNSVDSARGRGQLRKLTFNAESMALTHFMGRYALFTAIRRDTGRLARQLGAPGRSPLADTLFIAHLDSDTQWRVPVPHTIDRIANVHGRVLVLGSSGSGVSASLVTPGVVAALEHTIALPGAVGDWPGERTLAVQKVQTTADHYRAAFPVHIPARDSLDESYVHHNALWLIDVRDSLSHLGLLTPDSSTLRENAEVFPPDYQLGLVEGVWYDDRIFGLFYNELVAARIVAGRVQVRSRVKAPSLPPE